MIVNESVIRIVICHSAIPQIEGYSARGQNMFNEHETGFMRLQ